MDNDKRLVIGLPLVSLWNEDGLLDARRGRELTDAEIRVMLRSGTVRFIVADCGLPLSWVAPTDCYDFWKREVQPHLHDEARPYLDDYPNGYSYFAHEWQVGDGGPIVVLEKHH